MKNSERGRGKDVIEREKERVEMKQTMKNMSRCCLKNGRTVKLDSP